MSQWVINERIYPYTEYNTNVKYNASISAVNDLINYMVTATDLGTLFDEPHQYLNSVMAFPFNIDNLAHSTTTENIKVGKEETGISAKKLNNPNKILSLGTIEIPRKFNNFLDLAPYTSIDLYLPYLGFFTLDPNEVVGKKLKIYYAIDLDTGITNAYVQLDGGHPSLEDDVVILTANGKIGFEIPVGASNARDNARNLLTGIASTVAGVAITAGSGGLGATAGVAMGLKGIKSIVSSLNVKYSKGNLTGGKSAGFGPQSPYVIITTPKKVNVSNYNHLYGKPCGQTYKLANLSGYTEVEQVHLSGLNTATKQEINKIEQLLKQGVHL